MARVNVETRALAEGRFTKLMEDLRMSRAETLGTLVLFWHDSQEQEVWKATKERVKEFVPDEARAEDVFNALVRRRYVSECPDGEFTIHGNRKHIEAHSELQEAGRRGGLKSGETRREHALDGKPEQKLLAQKLARDAVRRGELSKPKACEDCDKEVRLQAHHPDYSKPLEVVWLCSSCHAAEHTLLRHKSINSRLGEAGLDSNEPNTIQVSSMHDNASQDSAVQPSSDQGNFFPPPAGAGRKEPNPLNGRTWEAYSAAYLERWREEPVRNASVNSQIAAMVKRVGADAPFVAEFYVGHNDSFYVRALHPVGLMLRDCEKLRTEWKRGVQMLGSNAREVERREANNSAIDRAFDRLGEMGFRFAPG